jgi:hypothetical protein
MKTIDDLVREVWPRLARGDKIHVALRHVEHPRDRPDLFTGLPNAWPDGQRCDYAWRLRDGGRVHAQCFGTGEGATIRFHLDRWDPDAGPVPALLHVLFETPLGRVASLTAAAVAAFTLGRKFLGKAGPS